MIRERQITLDLLDKMVDELASVKCKRFPVGAYKVLKKYTKKMKQVAENKLRGGERT